MSKEFKQVPKPKPPSDEIIEAFERGGPGHDHKRTNVSLSENTNAHPHKDANELMGDSTKTHTHIDANAQKHIDTIEQAPEPIKRLSVNMPLSTHRRFKTACSAAGTQMFPEIVRLVEQRIEELESELGIEHKDT